MIDKNLNNTFLIEERTHHDMTGYYIVRKYKIKYEPLDPEKIVKKLAKANFDAVGIEHEERYIICEHRTLRKKIDKHVLHLLKEIDNEINESRKRSK